MKRFVPRLLLSLVAIVTLQAGPRDDLWKEVEKAASEEKPESVVALLQKIEAAATAEKAWPDAARALATRLRVEAGQEDNDPGKYLREIDAAAATGPGEMRPMLRALSAVFYAGYFRENRWELMDRTPVAETKNSDVSTWDLGRLLAETDKRFQNALADAAQLKATPVTAWDGLLEPGALPDSYQPTVFDFVARQALQFYTSAGQESVEVKAGNAFEITADSPALGTMEEFLAWNPGEGPAPKLRAIRIYQALLAFHRGDNDPGARVVLDVDRLRWAADAAEVTAAMGRLKTQLTALVDKHAGHECCLPAAAHAAEVLVKEKNRAPAHALLTRVLEAHGKSKFAPLCRNVLIDIEAKELEASTELIWNNAGPEIHFTARNLEKVHFRLILVSKDPDPAVLAGIEDNEDQVAKLLRKRPAREWALDLGKQSGFESQTHHVPAPVDVKPGLYLLAASGNAEFIKRRNQISWAPVLVSPLSLVTSQDSERVEAWVMDAVSGDPVAGASVSLWIPDEKTDKLKPQTSIVTDQNGYAAFRSEADSDSRLLATANGATAFSNSLSSPSHDRPGTKEPDKTTFLFTDRALYRPGQTIQFKGIHALRDTAKNSYRTLSGVKRTLVLKDYNGRELGKQVLTTNAFGSFSGTFTAPQSGITGELTLQDGTSGVKLSVEEYKRPRFSVEILPPAVPPAAGQQVTVKVKATSYTGAPVDGARVHWNVVREAEWSASDSARWWFKPSSTRTQMAAGDATTTADGTAEIKFAAIPDKSRNDRVNPWFRFAVHADVTDPAGETRSGEGSVRVGESTVKAGIHAEDWQSAARPVTFTLTTTTLDDAPVKSQGKLTVYRLTAPDKVHRPQLDDEYSPNGEPYKDLSDFTAWDSGEVVQRNDAATDDKGEGTTAVKLSAGAYRTIFETKDAGGKKVSAQTELVVVNPAADRFPVKVPFWTSAESLTLQPGEDLSVLWGSGYDRARAYIKIEHRGKMVQSFWTDAARTQQSLNFRIKEQHRGGLSVHIMQLRDNRLEVSTLPVQVPWTNKNLTLKWEHLTSKLEPGAKEVWSLSIAGPNQEKVAAELTGVLYDASLDALAPHQWPKGLDCFYKDRSFFNPGSCNELIDFEELVDGWGVFHEAADISLRDWPFSLFSSVRPDTGKSVVTQGLRFGSDAISRNAIDSLIAVGGAVSGSPRRSKAALPAPEAASEFDLFDFSISGGATGYESPAPNNEAQPAGATATAARRNLKETAFFLPQLTTADDGTVKLQFTMPEAVTAWRFMGLAHDTMLRSGYIEGTTVTARDLMVQPNPPRFLREGDTVEFTAKITNQSDSPQRGTARLSLADAATQKSANAALGLTAPDQAFDVPAKESRTVSWRITVPDGQGFLSWKATAGTDKTSDGEEGWLPVLPRRTLVTESLPLTINGAGTAGFEFQKLKDSSASPTLRHQSLTVQVTSQPAWYAVMALPYLIEFPHECSEQTFNRFYANALARHIAGKDPAIRRIFDLWRDAQPAALQSQLLKNQELKCVLIEETPWLREATGESEQRRNVGLLFDDNRLSAETDRVLSQLKSMQTGEGAWPWFPGGPASDFITLYIVSGFGRLRHLGVEVESAAALEALESLDHWLTTQHKAALKADRQRKDGKEGDHFDASIALYLYARSFFLTDRPVPEEQRPAVDYFLAQARSHWTGKGRMTQAHAALGLLRFGDKAAAAGILASIKERSVLKPEQGRYWVDERTGWRWDSAPLETQALMIEAFRDIGKATATADECALWLLRQKQTQAWSSTKATADACYALLLGSGPGKLTADPGVSISLGDKEVKPENTEAGTGFFERKFQAPEIVPAMSSVKLTKQGDGPAWGSVHWQYLEDMAKLTPQDNTPLKVSKALFTKVVTASGTELRPVQGKVKVGDELVVRLELRTDRDMEFVHLKDQRPSSVEPVNVLSGYRYQDRLGYYESTRDAASHFFFDVLPKGTHVFEYSSRVQLRGACQTGVAELQCMYAPEFNSHSASTLLEVE